MKKNKKVSRQKDRTKSSSASSLPKRLQQPEVGQTKARSHFLRHIQQENESEAEHPGLKLVSTGDTSIVVSSLPHCSKLPVPVLLFFLNVYFPST